MTARAPLDLSLYLITDTAMCAPRGIAGTVTDAVRAGVTAVQLRDPAAGDDEFVALGQLVKAVLRPTGVPLIVNDRVHLVEAIGAEGAHVGQDDLDPAEARRILGPTAYLGLSAQSVEHVEAAQQLGEDTLDYLGVGPVWPTSSKHDASPPGGVERLREVSQVSPWPCVAIGGITAERAGALRSTGVAGIAVVSAICGQDDVGAATRALRDAWADAPA